MLTLRATRFIDYCNPNTIRVLMNILLISLRISLYLLALRRLYFFISYYLKNYKKYTLNPVKSLPETLPFKTCYNRV
jgi:hypothetical protein